MEVLETVFSIKSSIICSECSEELPELHNLKKNNIINYLQNWLSRQYCFVMVNLLKRPFDKLIGSGVLLKIYFTSNPFCESTPEDMNWVLYYIILNCKKKKSTLYRNRKLGP